VFQATAVNFLQLRHVVWQTKGMKTKSRSDKLRVTIALSIVVLYAGIMIAGLIAHLINTGLQTSP
jgi:hypothetical protein